jgi:phosphoglycerol transferase
MLQPAEQRVRLRRAALFAVVQALVVTAAVGMVLRPWRYDMRVPFYYGSDALWFVSVVKGLIENGWTFEIPHLSAPFSLHAVAFPAITTFDWILMKGLALFSDSAGAVLNGFWLLSLVLTAWSASAALVLLGVAPWLGFVGGVTYALLPGAFIRNVVHICLVYYAVPLLCLLAISIARGGFGDRRDRPIRILGYVAVLVQGLNYVYFSLFAALLFGVAGLVAALRERRPGALRPALLACGILLLVTAANLAPSLGSWLRDGKPPNMDYKYAGEAEVYGLTIRRLVSPHRENPVASIGAWRELDSGIGFPADNENVAARLGLLASLGLIVMLGAATALVRSGGPEVSRTLHAIGALGLATLLLATTGGFGSVINVLTIPDIRAYNRLSVFLAFFAIASLLLWLSALWHAPRSAGRRRALVVVTAGVAALSLYDQLLDAVTLARRQPANLAEARRDERLVRALERQLAPGAAIFQWPITPFPADGGLGRMLAYDHARPTVWSSRLRWSWPSFSQRHHAWLAGVENRSGRDLLERLTLSGFDALWIDRFGLPDGGEAMVDQLRAAGAPLLERDGEVRYAILDLRPVGQELRASLGADGFAAESRRILDPSGKAETALTRPRNPSSSARQ